MSTLNSPQTDDSLVSSPSILMVPNTVTGVAPNGTAYEARYGLLLSQYLPPNSKYDAKLEEAFNRAFKACTKLEDDGWEFNQEQMGIKIYLKKPEADDKHTVPYCKGIGTIPNDIETVRSIFSCSEIKSEYDQMYNDGRIVDLVDPNTVVAYASFKGVWPISGRDFCTIGRAVVLPEEQGGGTFTYYTSFEHPSAPLVSKYVRGDLKFNGLLLQPNKEDPTHTDVTYCVAQDPKGSLPKSIIEVANLLQPRTIAIVRDLIANKPTLVEQALNYEKKKFNDALTITMATPAPAIGTGNGGNSDNNGQDGGAGNNCNSEFKPAEEGDFDQNEYSFGVVLPQTELTPEQKQHLDDAFDKGWKSVHEDDGWDYYKEVEGVKIWLKPSGVGPVKLSKGIGIINAPPSHTHSMFTNESTRKEWDTMFNHGSIIEQLDTNTYIGYGAFDAPWPISGRDFTTITRTVLLKDGSIFHWSTNFITPKSPPNTKFVRGKLLFSGLLIQPIENNTKSKIIYAIGSDPSGSLPAAVAEAAALSQPLCIASIGNIVLKKPNVVEQAISSTLAKYEKITGSGSGFNISRETLPSIGSIEWPTINDIETNDESNGISAKWLKDLHDFHKKSHFQRIISSISYANTNGGLFRSLSTKSITTTTTSSSNNNNNNTNDGSAINEKNNNILNDNKNLPFGHIAMKITHLRGKYLSILNNMSLYFTITFENDQIKTPNAPYFDGILPVKKDKHGDPIPNPPINPNLSHTLSKPITRYDSIVLIELWGEQRQEQQRSGISRACLGSLKLTLGELFEGNIDNTINHSNNSIGYGLPTKARRCWFPLTNIPIEIDRSCTHYELLQTRTKSGKNKLLSRSDNNNNNNDYDQLDGIQYLDDPRGIFICFESCIILSPFQLYINDILSLENSHVQLSNPHSTLSSMSLSLPPSLCKHPKILLEQAHIPKDRELCRLVGLIGMNLTGGALLSTDIEPDDLAAATSTFSSHLFIRNIIRCFIALQPLLTIINLIYDLITWVSPVHTLFTMLLWIFLCFHPYLFIPFITIFILYTITLSCADFHFSQAASRSNTVYANSLKQRYIIAQYYTDQLHTLIPQLSPRVQAIGVLIQVITGRIATMLELFFSLFFWSRLNDNALMISIISTITLIISIHKDLINLIPILFTGGDITSSISIEKSYRIGSWFFSDPFSNNNTISNSLTSSTMLLIAPVTILAPILLLLAWNGKILTRLKLLFGSFFRSRLIIHHIRRESRTIRLFSGEPKQ